MNKNKGFSLIELMVVVAIVGVIASMAVPSFRGVLQRNQLKAVLQSIQDDLQHARTLAIKQSQNVTLRATRTATTAGAWCYGVSTGTVACDCTAAASTTNCDVKIISGASFSTTVMATANATTAIAFDFRRGTIAAATELPFSTIDYKSSVFVDTAGRVRTCAPSDVTGFTALPALGC